MHDLQQLGRGHLGSLPPLAISSSKKTPKYYEKVLNTLEFIAVRQYIAKTKYNDIIRMINGKQSIKEVSEVVPFIKNLSPDLVESAIPRYIRHHDVFGQIINATTETFMLTKDDFYIGAIDEWSSNDTIRTNELLMQRFLRGTIQTEIASRLQEMGLEADLSSMDFGSEEEELEYQNFLAQTQEELTPDGIERYMSGGGYKLGAVTWGDITLRNDFKRFNEENMIRQNMLEFLGTGECFRHYHIGYDYYEPQFWPMTEVFYSEEQNLRYPHKAEYIGRISHRTISQIMSGFGSILPSKLIDKIQKYTEQELGNGNWGLIPPYVFDKPNADIPKMLPSADFHERKFVQNVENTFRVPLTDITFMGECGLETKKGFASNSFYPKGSNYLYSEARSASLKPLRYDLFQVMEVYFRDWQKEGLLCLENEFGTKIFETVTEDILDDFLKDLGIKEVKSKSIQEMSEKPEANTITWYYTPYSRKGIKINLELFDEHPFYYTEKTACQIPGNSDMFEICHPVAGYIGDGMGDRLENIQALHNLAMNQLQEFMEKDTGAMYLIDRILLAQSEQEENGQSTEATELLMTLGKALGYSGYSMPDTGFSDAPLNYTGIQKIDLSYVENIRTRVELALMFKQQAYDLIGIKVGANAPPDNYKTAEGVRIDREAQYAQLEHYFSQFTDFLKEAYTIQLAVAQYCQIQGKDASGVYTQNDGTQAYLRFADPKFGLRRLAIYPISNAKERKQRDLMQQLFLSNNTITSDPLSLASLIANDTVAGMLATAKESRQYQEQLIQQQQQNTLQAVQQKEESDQRVAYFKWSLEEISKEKDRQNILYKAGIDAMGRALYRNAGTENADIIEDQVDSSIRETKLRDDRNNNAEKNQLKRTSDNRSYEIEKEKLALEDRRIRATENRTNGLRFVAAVNNS